MLRIGQVEATAQNGKYTDGNVAGGVAATRLRAAAFNAMQEELANIVESAGMQLSVDDMTQVLTALKKLFLSRANPFADIKSDGAAAVAMALSNLGLGTAAKKDVGTGTGQIPDMSSYSYQANGINAYAYTLPMAGSNFKLVMDTILLPPGVTNMAVPYPFPNKARTVLITQRSQDVAPTGSITADITANNTIRFVNWAAGSILAQYFLIGG